jgi:hypothetical protein
VNFIVEWHFSIIISLWNIFSLTINDVHRFAIDIMSSNPRIAIVIRNVLFYRWSKLIDYLFFFFQKWNDTRETVLQFESLLKTKMWSWLESLFQCGSFGRFTAAPIISDWPLEWLIEMVIFFWQAWPGIPRPVRNKVTKLSTIAREIVDVTWREWDETEYKENRRWTFVSNNIPE